MRGLALFYLFDPGGGESQGIYIVGLVGVGFSETGADEGLGGVGDAPAVECGDDVLDEIEDVVGGGFGRCLGGGADGVVVGDGEDDGSLSKAGTVCGHGVVDVVEVDEAAGPFDWGLREVELVPVLVDVLERGDEGGEAGLDGEKNLFHICEL